VVRGFHLDLRIQVMRPEALKDLASRLSDLGIGALVMEWEASFPFSSHPVIPSRYAYTPAQVDSFIRHCGGLGIDVIPLQQSFGHLEYILRHPRYQGLREDPKDHSQLCPLQTQGNQRLLEDLFGELVRSHPSPYLHIGGDETRLLGRCPRCRQRTGRIGAAGLYALHMGMAARAAVALGKRPLLWADMLCKHPEALKALPKSSVLVDWNYGWKGDLFGDPENLRRSGLEVWGAAALRSDPDNYFLVDWEKHLRNFRDFVPRARKLGYAGMLVCSWSTSGEYARVMESTADLVDLEPVRRVYPLAGFELPLAAFAQSLGSDAPLDVKGFVRGYGAQRYGFDSRESDRFWKALTACPLEVRQGKVEGGLSVSGLMRRSEAAARTLHGLRPKKGRKEFGHYRLLGDIRLQYLRYQVLEAEANAPKARPASLARIRRSLGALLAAAPGLDRRFQALHAASLHQGEILAENRLRRAKIEMLFDKLSRRR
jgi:hexosaminidase